MNEEQKQNQILHNEQEISPKPTVGQPGDSRGGRLTSTYRVPKGMGIQKSRPLIRDWKGSTPSAAILKIPTLTAQISPAKGGMLGQHPFLAKTVLPESAGTAERSGR